MPINALVSDSPVQNASENAPEMPLVSEERLPGYLHNHCPCGMEFYISPSVAEPSVFGIPRVKSDVKEIPGYHISPERFLYCTRKCLLDFTDD